MAIITEEQLSLYISLFKGREDIYARRWEKAEKSGYAPAYKFDWNEYLIFKSQGGAFKDFNNKQKIPLTKDIVKKHLIGAYFIGIYPLLDDDSSYFIAIDLDGKNWKKDCRSFIDLFNSYSIPAYVEKSFSGNGCHIWIFFEDRYPAVKSRKIFLEFAKQILELPEFEKELSFDRLFPNQDYHTGAGIGNLIALPLQGRKVIEEKMVFLDPADLKTVPDQWSYLGKVRKITTVQLEQLYSQVCGKSDLINELKLNDSEFKGASFDRISDKKELFEQGILNIVLKNYIILNKIEIGKKLRDFLKENLIFVNSEYLIKKKIGKSTYGTQKFFNLISESKNEIKIPRGFLNALMDFCTLSGIKFKLSDQRNKLKNIEFNSKVKLLDNQEDILKKVRNIDSGVITAPPGSGKTIIGIELIAEKKQPALILVHRKQIYEQWTDRIVNFLGISKKDIGQICANKKNISGSITVAMVQSLAKFPRLKEIGDRFGTIIIDECHHIPAKSFRSVITNFNPYFIYGLTATPKRKYNDEKLIFLYIGEIIYEAKNSGLLERENEAQASIRVQIRDTALDFPYNNKTDDFQLLSKVLIYDCARNSLISRDVINAVNDNHKVLILTERKDHVDVLNAFLKSSCEVLCITGDDSKSSKKIKLKQVTDGNFQVLITTGQLLGEGFDVQGLSCLFLVFPFSFEGKLIQYIGRILRTAGAKYIYDYRDKNIDFLEKLYKNRQKYYKKII